MASVFITPLEKPESFKLRNTNILDNQNLTVALGVSCRVLSNRLARRQRMSYQAGVQNVLNRDELALLPLGLRPYISRYTAYSYIMLQHPVTSQNGRPPVIVCKNLEVSNIIKKKKLFSKLDLKKVFRFTIPAGH